MKGRGMGVRCSWIVRAGTLLGLVAATGLLPAAAAAAKPDYRVKVTRTESGIPHVVAQDYRSLGYGQGYVYAQDNACLLLDTVVTVRGERSRFFGANNFARNYSNGASDPNYKSDAYWKWIEASGARAKLAKGLEGQPKQLFRGWVEGFNRYVTSKRLRDPACRTAPWRRKIKVTDLELRGIQVITAAGSSSLISGIYDAQPPGGGGGGAGAGADAGSGAAQTQGEPDIPALRDQFREPPGESELGSNGLAIGSAATRRGTGMLLANPHFPWRGIDRFWMAHLTVKGKGAMNVMGGTLGGLPMIGVGFNKGLAWTHTVSTGRRFVFRELDLAPGDPTSYVVDGKTIPMTRRTVNVDGQTHTFYETQFGPVVVVPAAAFGWNSTTAYALTDSNIDNTKVVSQYLKMARAGTVGKLLKVEERGKAVPFFNTIAADRKGVALYTDVGRYSNVPKSLIDACLPPGLPQAIFNQARVITLDGSRSACTPDGLLPAGQMPRIARRDYVLNSNDSYWVANPAAPITGITPLIGLERTAQGLRTRSGNVMMREALSGGRMTLGRLQQLFLNDRNYLAELISRPLADLCTANPSVTLGDGTVVDISEACPILRNFDNTGNLDSPGAWLFAVFTRRAPGGLFSDPFDPSDPIGTPSVLNTANPEVLRALGASVKELRDHGVPLASGMRGVQVATRGSERIPIHGCIQCFQNIGGSPGSVMGETIPYGEVVHGSSMVLASDMRKSGPHVQGFLTYSQATDPTSPWFKNMTEKFSNKKWVRLPFTPGQIRKAKRTRVKLPGAPKGKKGK